MHVTEYLGYTSPPLKILERSLGEDIFVKYLTHTKQQLKLQLVKIVTLLMLITLALVADFYQHTLWFQDIHKPFLCNASNVPCPFWIHAHGVRTRVPTLEKNKPM